MLSKHFRLYHSRPGGNSTLAALWHANNPLVDLSTVDSIPEELNLNLCQEAIKIDKACHLLVRRSSGCVTKLADILSDQILAVKEGEGIVRYSFRKVAGNAACERVLDRKIARILQMFRGTAPLLRMRIRHRLRKRPRVARQVISVVLPFAVRVS